jgi:hypothetical protein
MQYANALQLYDGALKALAEICPTLTPFIGTENGQKATSTSKGSSGTKGSTTVTLLTPPKGELSPHIIKLYVAALANRMICFAEEVTFNQIDVRQISTF